MVKRLLMIMCGAILAIGVQSSYAGPVQSELKSYRCLVPDFLISSGGTSPALSPDGTVLVYLTQQPDDYMNDKVWVLTDADKQLDQASSAPPLQPWELKVETDFSTNKYELGTGMLGGQYRNVDWSPDGKRVVFTHHGQLYIADLDDLKAKQTKVKKLADIVKKPDSSDYQPNLAPRWSPDGTRVAFLSPNDGLPPLSSVYVVDVGTGKLTAVAQDAIPIPQIWEQPWSPDGRYIIYSSIAFLKKSENSVSIDLGGISIATVGGGQSRRIIDENMTFGPSWSPDKDRIAYVGLAKSNGLGKISTAVYVSDKSGQKPVRVGALSLSETSMASARAEIRNTLLKTIKEDYPGIFTKPQIDAISHIQMTDRNIAGLVGLAESRIAAETIGEDYLWKAKAVLRQLSGNLKNLNDCANIMRKATKALPEDKRKTIDNVIDKRIMGLMTPLFRMQPIDTTPVWSPDGKRIAFIRSGVGGMELIVVDVVTRKSKAVFESNMIGDVSWVGNGKMLLLQAKRNLAYTQDDSKSGLVAFVDRFVGSTATTVSYPEVWLLELK